MKIEKRSRLSVGELRQTVRMAGLVVLGLGLTTARAHADATGYAEAVRLNNRGVAQMGQQFTEKAADSFADAMKADPKLAQAAVNEGIALLALQKLDGAKAALQKGIALDPKSAQAWYNLGLAQHAGNELDAALKSFQEAVRLDPRDVDSYYFEGVCLAELKEYPKAIAVFKQALEISPLHASAEFALARALQRSGNTQDAREHFKRFQHLTSTKVSSAIGLAYGEQGRYSTVTPVEEHETARKPMIPVKLVAESMGPPVPRHAVPGASTFSAGACMLDATGSGQMDLVVMASGEQAISVLHRTTAGKFEALNAAAVGLKADGHAVA
ncbi:MAG TPA: tetratricopeptide repeat protein, partial [Candidatus Saccharimonadales bacterium]|nr:tetratricopeptide repeat protein [Candidatus Saccharimonadales bacterium]